MTYPPAVERWRPLVAKYVPPQYVDKVLWVIQHESGGNPSAIGDGGVAIGLLQIHDNNSIAGRPTKEQLLDPEFNIRYAAQQLGMASGNFRAWGEGTENYSYTYDPKTGKGKFGALGFHPYPGDSGGGGAMPDQDFYDRVGSLYPRWRELDAKANLLQQLAEMDLIEVRDGAFVVAGSGEVVMTLDEFTEYKRLDDELGAIASEYENTYGPTALKDFIDRAIKLYEYDPRTIAARKAVEDYTRGIQLRIQAVSEAQNVIDQQNKLLDMAQKNDPGYYYAPGDPKRRIGNPVFVAPPKLRTFEEVFNKSIEDLKKSLPEVPAPPGLDLSGAPSGTPYSTILSQVAKKSAEAMTPPGGTSVYYTGVPWRQPPIPSVPPTDWVQRVKDFPLGPPSWDLTTPVSKRPYGWEEDFINWRRKLAKEEEERDKARRPDWFWAPHKVAKQNQSESSTAKPPPTPGFQAQPPGYGKLPQPAWKYQSLYKMFENRQKKK
jgi:hypothetical protein